MAKYDVEIFVTDKYLKHLKKGVNSLSFSMDTTLDKIREITYHNYFRNAELRSMFYSATIKSGSRKVGEVFVNRLGGKPNGELVYIFVEPNFTFNLPTYIVDKKTGKIIGTEESVDEYVHVRGALGTGMNIRTGAKFYVKRL